MIRHRSIAFVNLFLIKSTLRISLITKSSRKSKNRRKRVGTESLDQRERSEIGRILSYLMP